MRAIQRRRNGLNTSSTSSLAMSIGLPVASLVAILMIWQISVSQGWVDAFFFSSPLRLIETGRQELADPQFWTDVQVTVWEFTMGYVAALFAGTVVGLVTGWYRRLAMLVDPWLNAFNSMPRIALLPLIVLWVGLGVWSKVVVVFVGVFFPVALNVFHGVKTVEPRFVQVSNSFGASRRLLFVTVILPSVVPFLTTGARLGVGRGVAGVTVGEFYSADAGLMHRVLVAGRQFQIDEVLFGTLAMTVFALVVHLIARRSEVFLLRHRDGR